MSNKTFIPAFQCTVGDWKYYICMMKYAEVARSVQFAFELNNNNSELGQLIQRGISDRTKGITEYLLKSKHRFLGGLVVAAWGGTPQYTTLSMDDPDGILKGLDREFGVLTFDGTQSYFVLDGQHRLRAIKDAIKKDPALNQEDICVLIVTHYDSVEGRVRTRRLFSNINRNAKQTAAAENIALDEDDGFAILTRRIIEDHEFLSEDKRVRVILSQGEDGELKLATSSVPKGDAAALTTFTVLYDLLQYLGWDLAGAMKKKQQRPLDDVLDESYGMLVKRLDDLLLHCGDIQNKLKEAASARDIRSPRHDENNGHAFMRPIVQKAVARVASQLIQQNLITWDELMSRISELDWRISQVPWLAIYNAETHKMLTGRENIDALDALLRCHLAPASKEEIKRARKAYKDARGAAYPVPEETLALRLPQAGAESVPPPPVVLPEELSAQIETEAGEPRDSIPE